MRSKFLFFTVIFLIGLFFIIEAASTDISNSAGFIRSVFRMLLGGMMLGPALIFLEKKTSSSL